MDSRCMAVSFSSVPGRVSGPCDGLYQPPGRGGQRRFKVKLTIDMACSRQRGPAPGASRMHVPGTKLRAAGSSRYRSSCSCTTTAMLRRAGTFGLAGVQRPRPAHHARQTVAAPGRRAPRPVRRAGAGHHRVLPPGRAGSSNWSATSATGGGGAYRAGQALQVWASRTACIGGPR